MTNLPSRTPYVVTAYDDSGCIDGRSALGPNALRKTIRQMFSETKVRRVDVGRVAGGRVVDQRSFSDLADVDSV